MGGQGGEESSPSDQVLGTGMWLLPKLRARTGVFKLQVMSEGGPQPQSIIHFSVSNETVAVVNRRGQVTGKVVGTTVLQGTIQTVNEDTGKVTVFSQVPSLPRPRCSGGAPTGRPGRRPPAGEEAAGRGGGHQPGEEAAGRGGGRRPGAAFQPPQLPCF